LSPETGINVVESGDLLELNIPYEIVFVEDLVTQVSMYRGFRVHMLSEEGRDGGVMLWKQEIVGVRSKTGVFITLLGTNTDDWLHKWIIFRAWERNSRRVELINPPKPEKK